MISFLWYVRESRSLVPDVDKIGLCGIASFHIRSVLHECLAVVIAKIGNEGASHSCHRNVC